MSPLKFCAAMLLATVSWILPAQDFETELEAEREQFERAYKALTSGRKTEAKNRIAGLEDYPLYIYYRYYLLRQSLHAQKSQTVREFLTAYDGSYLAARLRTQWLSHLFRRKRWDDFLHDYRPQKETKLQCAHIVARIKTDALEGIAGDARALWLVGKSQPDECDAAFNFLKANGLLTDQLIWQRVELAFDNNKRGLAGYLIKQLKDDKLREAGDYWLEVHANPNAALKQPYFKNDTLLTRKLFVYAVARVARKNAERADQLFARYRERYALTERDLGMIRQKVGIAAASQRRDDRISHLDAIPESFVTDKVEKYRIRNAIEDRAWNKLVTWTERDPVGSTDRLRWRYWRARALEETGDPVKAETIYRELAKHRDYYGFLSADRIDAEYQMNDNPILPAETEIAEVSARPGIMRARELFFLDMPFKARREWHHEVEKLSRRELEVAAYLVNQWGWYDRAIFALGSAKSYDALAIRFPLLHTELVRSYAKKRGLDEAIILAIIRQESAFMDDARSPAGALGLMQVMPRTGRETARQIGAKFRSAKDLLDPRKNVMIGSAYLKSMLRRFKGSFSMAAAAYNAGPHRVKKWLPDTGCVPADVWVDTIPFTETRRYVRRASFYSVVYQWRLKQDLARIGSRLSDVSSTGATGQC